MATSIATGVLPPRIAVALSGLLNLVGAFLSLAVAATIASGLVNTKLVTLTVVAAGLAGGIIWNLVTWLFGIPSSSSHALIGGVIGSTGGAPGGARAPAPGRSGGIIWNLVTWLFGIPSSSSHALIGGVIGSTIAAAGGHAIKWHGLTSKVVVPAVLSPVIAALVAATGTWLLYRISRSLTDGARRHGFRIGQIGSACMVSLAHGTNDAQKTMGVITLALIANKTLHSGANAPFWVILSCALAISIGTYLGGWRVIRTLGKGLVEIESPQGMAAESASAAVILLSSSFGYSLSTTHVATGSIIGTGLGKKGAEVRWNVAGRMATAWVFTLPSAAVVGAGAYALAHVIGGSAGVIVDLVILVAISAGIYLRSRGSKVDHNNVNDDWTGSVAPAEPEPAAAA